jgi:rare lipoprotein A (peptidoglycan hydrolase)
VWAVDGLSAIKSQDALPEGSARSSGGLVPGPTRVVSVVLRGKAHDVWTNATTVGGLLSAMRIEPDWNDRVVPPPATPLSETSTVHYTAVDVHEQTTVRAGELRDVLVRTVDGRPVWRRLLWSRALAQPPSAVSSTVGEASWYQIDDGLSAASPWLPFGTRVTVTNLATGLSVTVVINDRGPFGGRIIDLSPEAFSKIAPLGQGVCQVRLTW